MLGRACEDLAGGHELHDAKYAGRELPLGIICVISVTCPEALMGLSAMGFFIMRSRVYPTSA